VPHILTAAEEEAVFGGPEVLSPPAADPMQLQQEQKRDITALTTPQLQENDKYMHVAEYLRSCRLNINVRQVVRQGGAWESKCGLGAMQMNATKPPEFKLV
jgi:hypothetical protein